MKRKPVILVDGSSYLFRAYYALPPLNNSKGQPTGAIYGVLNMLRKLLKDFNPDYVAVVFDAKGKTFRHQLLPSYKANRVSMPNELSEQIKPLFEVIKALGLPLILREKVEADDVIGSLTRFWVEQDKEVLISTSDKDMAQLVNEKVQLINTMNNTMLDSDGVKEKFGVAPRQITDYLALMGDASDNIPGIPKVGSKTAAKWIHQYQSLEVLIKHADEIKGKVGDYLRRCIKDLPLFHELVTIQCHLDLKLSKDDLKLQPIQKKRLISLLTELEFTGWLNEIEHLDSENKKSEKKNYSLILSKKQFETWIQKLNQSTCFALDTETTSIDSMQAILVGLSFAVKPYEAAYVPLHHDYLNAPKQLPKSWVLRKLKVLLEDPKKVVIGQNLKYDYKVLLNEDIHIKGVMRDTLLTSYVINGQSTRHDLDTLAKHFLKRTTIKYQDLMDDNNPDHFFNKVAVEQAAPYAAEDAEVTLQLHEYFSVIYNDKSFFKNVLKTIEWPLVRILAKMEYHGVLIDVDQLKKQSFDLSNRIIKLKTEMYSLVEKEFNIDSTKQLREVLFTELNIPILKKTSKGEASTAEAVIQRLSIEHPHPILRLILKYRHYTKLKTTYLDKLPKQINSRTGRIHTHYIQTGTTTGRLASRDPNLQNIPIRSEEGRKIRSAFIAPSGYRLIAADYSQIELRIMAHFSQDPGLLMAFKENKDVHVVTATEIFGLDESKVTLLQRRQAKVINFGLMYGMSSFGLSQQLKIGRQAAQQYIDQYFSSYPGVKDYMEASVEKARSQGYMETLFNRRINISNIHSKNALHRKAAERAAINAPLQGTAADIIKLAMIDVDRFLNQEDDSSVSMLMQIHDELIFEAPVETVDSVASRIQTCMEKVTQLTVPLVVNTGVGRHWDEAH